MKKKIIEISLFVTEICPKNHQILGDFSFFPYNKLTGIETDNVPRLKKLKTRCFECIRMYIDGKKCQDLYDFFARISPLAHALYVTLLLASLEIWKILNI